MSTYDLKAVLTHKSKVTVQVFLIDDDFGNYETKTIMMRK